MINVFEYLSGWFLLTSMSLKRFVGVPKFLTCPYHINICYAQVLSTIYCSYLKKSVKIKSPKSPGRFSKPRIYYSKSHWLFPQPESRNTNARKNIGIKIKKHLQQRIWGPKNISCNSWWPVALPFSPLLLNSFRKQLFLTTKKILRCAHRHLLLMAEIPNNHLGWCWNPINNGKNYQPQLSTG